VVTYHDRQRSDEVSKAMHLRNAARNIERKAEAAQQAKMEQRRRWRLPIEYLWPEYRYVYSDGSAVDPDDPRVPTLIEREKWGIGRGGRV
jgi:hypothetical protein